MTDNMNRRNFLKKSALFGLTTVAAGGRLIPATLEKRIAPDAGLPDLSVFTGIDYSTGTRKAVEALGGAAKFIPKGARVALLPNAQSRHPGTYTNPEILKAVINLCRTAGAKEVKVLSWLPEKSWKGSKLGDAVRESGATLKLIEREDRFFKPVPLPQGKALKQANVMRELDDSDVLIDMPIIKDHAGNKFTGTMKNLMGLNAPSCNQNFHKKNWETDPKALEHLDQCIADLNLAVTPDLCIVDATSFITTNGPFGPGKLAHPNKIVAGTDRIAIDAYCTGLLNLNPEDIIMIRRGHEHGLGKIDLSQVRIKEIAG